MKQDILNALCGNRNKYDLILDVTKEPEAVKLRREIFVILHEKGHKNKAIADFFNVRQPTVFSGIQKLTGSNKTALDGINDELVQSLMEKVNMNRKRVFIELKTLGYSQADIARYFKTSQSNVSKNIKDCIARDVMKERMSKIIKLRNDCNQ